MVGRRGEVMQTERIQIAQRAEHEEPKLGAFARNVLSLLERVQYRRCDKGEDLEAIFRLRYRAYRAHGFVPETPGQQTSDTFDDTPNAFCFGVFFEDELISTVRVHYLSQHYSDGPVMKSFGDVLLPRLERGETFINPTMLAADPDCTSIVRAIPYLTLRLAVIANAFFDTTSCVCVIREEHTAFYHRIFGATQVGEPRPYPPFTVPVMLYESRCDLNMASTVARFPFFRSTPLEQRMLFGTPREGELAPLTILPTAKYLNAAA
jgi:hypothetical protein